MTPKLQITLEFLHLENAIFCAEQSISAGAKLLEIGSTLLKNTGLTCVKILRERFPKIPIVVDMKIQRNVEQEIKSVANAGGNYVTISGATPGIWEECLEHGQQNDIKILIDFREIANSKQWLSQPFLNKVDGIMLSVDQDFSDLQQFASQLKIPIGITGVIEDEELTEVISMGTSTIAICFSDTKKNIQEVVEKAQKLIQDSKKTFPKDPFLVHEQSLLRSLDHLSPSLICETLGSSCYLNCVYPLHKYTKVIGKAATIKVWPGAQIPILEFLLELTAETILVIDAGGQGPAVWNQMFTEIALKQQLKAIVVYGSITDVNKIREKGLPCYTSSVTAITAQGTQTAIKNQPLQIGNVCISPGDWIIGDDTGVVCLPHKEAFVSINKAQILAQEKMKIIREIEVAQESELEDLVKSYIEDLAKDNDSA